MNSSRFRADRLHKHNMFDYRRCIQMPHYTQYAQHTFASNERKKKQYGESYQLNSLDKRRIELPDAGECIQTAGETT